MLSKPNFTQRLLTWYDDEARILPWRSNPTPYRIWISEMMLQQTRVETVIPYFQRFVTEIPDLAMLAEVDEDKLLKLWQGLGYYSRALNLKKAAAMIIDEYGGQIPSDRKTLQKLPGIGPYSAGAISSIAFQKTETLMDGNVIRVIARIYGITTDISEKDTLNQIHLILKDLISTQRPGDFNQALMELGATRCLPNGVPLCATCPVTDLCVSSIENRTADIPFKVGPKPRDIQKQTVLVLCLGRTYGIEKRPPKGLLAKLWTFPMIEGYITKEECQNQLKEFGYDVSKITPLPAAKHIFTHIEWHMIGYLVEVNSINNPTPLTWVTREEIDVHYAVPKAHAYYTKYLE